MGRIPYCFEKGSRCEARGIKVTELNRRTENDLDVPGDAVHIADIYTTSTTRYIFSIPPKPELKLKISWSRSETVLHGRLVCDIHADTYG